MSALVVRGDFTPEAIAKVEALYALPGESVRLNTRIRDAVPVSDHPFLTVRETVLSGTVDLPSVAYSFVEVEGEHKAGRFMSALPFENVYGALIEVDGAFWVVPLTVPIRDDDGTKAPVESDGEPRLLVRELTRAARHCFGQAEDAFFSLVTQEPFTGEFVLIDLDDGHWKLDYSPWSSGIDAEETDVARRAVATHATADPSAFFGR